MTSIPAKASQHAAGPLSPFYPTWHRGTPIRLAEVRDQNLTPDHPKWRWWCRETGTSAWPARMQIGTATPQKQPGGFLTKHFISRSKNSNRGICRSDLETGVCTKICMPTIGALFTMSRKKRIRRGGPSAGGTVNRPRRRHTVEDRVLTERNPVLLRATVQLNLHNIIPGTESQAPRPRADRPYPHAVLARAKLQRQKSHRGCLGLETDCNGTWGNVGVLEVMGPRLWVWMHNYTYFLKFIELCASNGWIS